MREHSVTVGDALAVTTDACFSMDEDEFRCFYDATGKALQQGSA